MGNQPSTALKRPDSITLGEEERLDWLCLSRTENVGPITFYELLKRFETARAALEALPTLSLRGGRRTPLIPFPRFKAEQELKRHQDFGAHLIAKCEDAYPSLLKEVPDATPLLSLKGNSSLSERPCLGLVGARNASLNGRKFAQKLSEDLSGSGYAIASGLARGIDTHAHLGALERGTVAVIAGGIDHIYPLENKKLYHEITEKGLLIAESPFGTVPQASYFPRRNRLISGMSLGIIVVEAALQSGSLVTARYALEQGREVFAVPGSPLDPRCHGTNKLLREGATLIERASHVLEALEKPYAFKSHTIPSVLSENEPAPTDQDILSLRKKLTECLSFSPIGLDELLRECHCPLSYLSLVLLELELAGKITRHPGHQISLRESD